MADERPCVTLDVDPDSCGMREKRLHEREVDP